MHKKISRPFGQIKKQQVEAAALFALSNIPEIDPTTTRRYLELVNATNLDPIDRDELREKMRLLLKYIPNSCYFSLLVLAELLDISAPHSPTDNARIGWITGTTFTPQQNPAPLH